MKKIALFVMMVVIFFSTNNINASHKIPKDSVGVCTSNISNPLLSEDIHQIDKSDGVYLYGFNGVGGLGLDPTIYSEITQEEAVKLVLPRGEVIDKYYVTNYNTFVLSKSGKLYIRGYNNVSQIRDSNKKVYLEFQEIPILKNEKIKSIKFSYATDSGKYSKIRLDLYLSNDSCAEQKEYKKIYYGYAGISRLETVLVDTKPSAYLYKQNSNISEESIISYNSKGEKQDEVYKKYDQNISSLTPIVEKNIEYSADKLSYVETFLLNKKVLYHYNTIAYNYDKFKVLKRKHTQIYNKNGDVIKEVVKNYRKVNNKLETSYFEEVIFNKNGDKKSVVKRSYKNNYYKKKLINIYTTNKYKNDELSNQVIVYKNIKNNRKILKINNTFKNKIVKRVIVSYYDNKKNSKKLIIINDYKKKKRYDYLYNKKGKTTYKIIYNQKSKKSYKYKYNSKGKVVKKYKVKFKKYQKLTKVVKKK